MHTTSAEGHKAGPLRRWLLIIAAAALVLAAILLSHRLKPGEAPEWNPLVMGYTVTMLIPAAALIFSAVALFLTSLSRSREAMARRLKRLVAFCASAVLCVVALDLVLSFFPKLQKPFVEAEALWPVGEYSVPDSELGFRTTPDLRVNFRFQPSRFGDILTTNQISRPEQSGEKDIDAEICTDADGFNSAGVPSACDMLAVGDSYTCHTNVPRDKYWPSLVAKEMSASLYNMGVPGYCPPQELIALRKYGMPKKPRVVLWGFFQGNDLTESAQFDDWRKSGTDWGTFTLRRMHLDRPFPYNRPVIRLAMFLAWKSGLATSSLPPLPDYPEPHKLSIGGVERPIVFNRWGFRILCCSREQLQRDLQRKQDPGIQPKLGWLETTESLLEAKKACDAAGVRLIVVYLPATLAVFGDDAIDKFDKEKIFRFAKLQLNELLKKEDGSEITPDEFIAMLKKNHNAIEEEMKDFCSKNGIEMVDTVPALQASLHAGEWPYYSYDTHLNVRGNEVVADTVCKYLKSNPQAPPASP